MKVNLAKSHGSTTVGSSWSFPQACHVFNDLISLFPFEPQFGSHLRAAGLRPRLPLVHSGRSASNIRSMASDAPSLGLVSRSASRSGWTRSTTEPQAIYTSRHVRAFLHFA